MAKAVGLRKAGKFADKDYMKEVEARRAEGVKKKPRLTAPQAALFRSPSPSRLVVIGLQSRENKT